MRALKKIWDVVTTLLVIVIVVTAVALVGSRLAGMQVLTVLSGSMEPTYHVGSLVLVKPTAPTELAPGDAISYLVSDNTVVTHRITGVVPDEEDAGVLRFRTKGDANDVEDGLLVHQNNVIGKVLFSVPLMGYVANYIQRPPGMYVALGIVLVVVIAAFLPDLLKPEEETKKKRS